MSPRVAVVLATRNQARWLPATIASVRAQTLRDFELVVVDDASTDETPAIAAAAAAEDTRVRVLRVSRRERAAARNHGVAATSAPLVAFLDGDDLWASEKLARQVERLDAAPAAALCYTVARYVDADDRPLAIRRPPVVVEGDVFPALARANRMILSSVVVRRAALDAAGGFDETLQVLGCEDWDLWLRLARSHPVVAVDAELTRYRVHAANTAQTAVLASGILVLERLYRDPGAATAARLSRRDALAALHWYHASAARDAGRLRALGIARRAFAAAPASVVTRPALGALARIVLPRGLLP